MSSNGYVMMQISPCRNDMMQMLWRKHNLLKKSLCFQIEASSTPETKIFSKLDLLFLKSHLLFYLRLTKNRWSLLEISEVGINLESDDLAQKIYFHNLVKQRDGTFPRPLFLEKWILWKSSILKDSFFFEYDNLTSVKTHCDSLEFKVQIF